MIQVYGLQKHANLDFNIKQKYMANIYFVFFLIQNLFKFVCIGSYKLIETLSNPFLKPTSTKQLM